ncbi:MAG: anthranilate synthase component I [Leptolyngbya sp. ERB_1_1]
MSSLLPWIWRSIPLHQRTGSEVFAALFLQDDIATLLESPYPASPDYPQLGRFSICAGQPRSTKVWTPAIGEILSFLNHLTRQSSILQAPEHLPFTGGWLGWLGYDLAWEIEQLPHLKAETLPFPVAFWYEPECFAVLDHEQQILWLAAGNEHQLDQLEKRLENLVQESFRSSAFQTQFCMTQADYEAIVLKAKQHIRAGDIFQANLSLRFEARTEAESWAIYRSLQSINPSPFASYWKTPWGDVISCSPERLVKLTNGIAETRPIAGTRPRGTTPEHDRQFAQELLDNAKEQAEHIMLVDLERNDLGRICEWGSVQVDELLAIERYSHVMHLVSNVVGKVRSQFNSIDVVRALFPGGTITGCPKVRCMEIIEALEPVRRNLFYGSCGYVDRRGNLDLNILIRTLLYTKAEDSAIVWGQVGAGIVADSDPEREWFESLQKARAQLAALGQQRF